MISIHNGPSQVIRLANGVDHNSISRVVIFMSFFIVSVFGWYSFSNGSSGPSDSRIRKTIQVRISKNTSITMEGVDLQVDNGIVLLSGAVTNLLQKSQARQIAESIVGVRSVVDNIRVTPHVRDDEAISRDIQKALDFPGPQPGMAISVFVEKGCCNLEWQR